LDFISIRGLWTIHLLTPFVGRGIGVQKTAETALSQPGFVGKDDRTSKIQNALSSKKKRSRMLQLREGDASAKFFHLHATYRRRKNHIVSLQLGDNTAFSQDDKARGDAAFLLQ
jgi:hypothetical protein